MSWLDAVSFCKALTILARNNHVPQNSEYRLPTEVEWEYGAVQDPPQVIILGMIQMNCTYMDGLNPIVKKEFILLA